VVTVFTPLEISTARALQQFDCSVQGLVKTTEREPGGRVVTTWAADGSPAIPGRLSPISSDEPIVLGRPSPRSRFYLVLPWDRDVADDALVDVTLPTGQTKRLSVIGRHTPRSYPILTKLIVEEPE
jgi:hypothetical protein